MECESTTIFKPKSDCMKVCRDRKGPSVATKKRVFHASKLLQRDVRLVSRNQHHPIARKASQLVNHRKSKDRDQDCCALVFKDVLILKISLQQVVEHLRLCCILVRMEIAKVANLDRSRRGRGGRGGDGRGSPKEARSAFDGLFDEIWIIDALSVSQSHRDTEFVQIALGTDLKDVCGQTVKEIVCDQKEGIVDRLEILLCDPQMYCCDRLQCVQDRKVHLTPFRPVIKVAPFVEALDDALCKVLCCRQSVCQNV